MNHKRKRIKKKTKQTKNVMTRKSRLFPIRFADSLKNEKKKNRNIGYMFFCFIYLSKKISLFFLKKFKVYGYIPFFPVVLIVQLYHKMALAKNLHEQKTLC